MYQDRESSTRSGIFISIGFPKWRLLQNATSLHGIGDARGGDGELSIGLGEGGGTVEGRGSE